MKAKAILATLAVALVAALDLTAQTPGGPCPAIYPDPKVGEYADLKFSSDEMGVMMIRFAVVGEEEIDSATYYWIEVVSVPPAVGDSVIARMLVPYYPFDQSDLKGYIVKMPGQPPLRMPQEMVKQLGAGGSPGPGWKEQCASARDLGPDSVVVPAGSFEARHYEAASPEGGEVWIANVPFGMVKWVQGLAEMELMDYGFDARSVITEKPVDYTPPSGGR